MLKYVFRTLGLYTYRSAQRNDFWLYNKIDEIKSKSCEHRGRSFALTHVQPLPNKWLGITIYAIRWLWFASCILMNVSLCVQTNITTVENSPHTPCKLRNTCATHNLEKAQKIRALLQKIHRHDKDGLTSLHYAIPDNNFDQDTAFKTIRILLARGAYVDMPDKYGRTPLYRAAMKGYYAIACLLLDHGAQINAYTQGGRTSLHAAAEFNHSKILQLLLERGAHQYAQDPYGSTPLHLAAAQNSYFAFKTFILHVMHHHIVDCRCQVKDAKKVFSLIHICLNNLVVQELKKDDLQHLPAELKEEFDKRKLIYMRAVLDIKNNQNKTAHDRAISNGNASFAQLIDHIYQAKTLDKLKAHIS